MATIALTVFLRIEMKSGTIEDASKFGGALIFSLINVMFSGMQELAMTVFRLQVLQIALGFAWPIGLMESGLWIGLHTFCR
ncbi:UNVERIFIED_CONTAM: Pleiotropic drug resistance protein 2 [Sesamum latifolium]|uniref:Pleiotropic drug resistance protein 2 n=1 Tax=Sesamum latifolium TaxID=2727402 RepID=A0AAW2UJR8_9LAMI